MVALDVDGTLLSSDRKITPRVLDAIAKVRAQGVRVVLASARPPRGLYSLYRQLNLDTPLVSYNGALTLAAPYWDILEHRPLPTLLFKKLLRLIQNVDPDAWIAIDSLDQWQEWPPPASDGLNEPRASASGESSPPPQEVPHQMGATQQAEGCCVQSPPPEASSPSDAAQQFQGAEGCCVPSSPPQVTEIQPPAQPGGTSPPLAPTESSCAEIQSLPLVVAEPAQVPFASWPRATDVDQPVTRLLVVPTTQRISALAAGLARDFAGQIVATIGDNNLVQIQHKSSDKAHGLHCVSALLGIDRENVMVVGDAINDLGMFAWAGLAVAMDNAQPKVRKIAHTVVPSNDDDGVAQALERYILSK
ncbi:MAG: HAD-IIB family hydrolase [Phycisphaeraceae bacterium]|nr:HAD-IIB family hydrolase [Phycisphaeraceae bacterium]